MGKTKRTLIIPVSFLASGAPQELSPTGKELRRVFRVSISFIDALELGNWISMIAQQIRSAISAFAVQERPKGNQTWGNGDTWGYSEDG